jgi:hypothetical protein
MHRTARGFFVLAILVGLMALGSPALPVMASTSSHPSRYSATTPHFHSARRKSHRASSHSAAHPAPPHNPCPAIAPRRRSPARSRLHCAPLNATRARLHVPVRSSRTAQTPVNEPTPKALQPSQPPSVDEAETVAADAAQAAGQAVAKTTSFPRRHAPVPPPLRGSLTSLTHQNEMADSEGLERIENEDDLADRIAHKLLVPVPTSAALAINGNLPESHRYCRPWTARFLADLARVHAARFKQPLEVSSAVRTVDYQKRLMTVNGNAAAAEGDIVSPHLTGATIDIAKSGMTRQEIGWMRAWLLPLQLAGKIDVEEEFQQACFHISVYKSYAPPKPFHPTMRAKFATPDSDPDLTPGPRPLPSPKKPVPVKTANPDNDTPA